MPPEDNDSMIANESAGSGPDINLVPEGYRTQHWALRRLSSRIGLVIAFLLLAASVAAYGGVTFWTSSLQERLDQLDAQIAELQAIRNQEEEQALLALEQRIRTADKLIEQKNHWSTLFVDVEELLVDPIRVNSLSGTVTQQDAVDVSLEVTATSYRDIASQLASFQSFQYTDAVTFEQFTLNDEGIVTAAGSLQLTIETLRPEERTSVTEEGNEMEEGSEQEQEEEDGSSIFLESGSEGGEENQQQGQ